MTNDYSSNLPAASFTRRLAAMVYDGFLVFAVWVAAIVIGLLIDGGTMKHKLLFQALSLIFIFSFFAYFWLKTGQTLGMQVWRIRIQNFEGDNISFNQAILRFTIAILSLVCFGLGFFWILIDRNKMSWHDRYSFSRVVQLPKHQKKTKHQ